MSIRFSEMEMRVLSILEEFQYENVPEMINTIVQPTGHARELTAMLKALAGLVRKGLVSMCVDNDAEGYIAPLAGEASIEVIREMESYVVFDSARGIWTNTRLKGPPFGVAFPLMLATKEAQGIGREILRVRGYRWWAPEKR